MTIAAVTQVTNVDRTRAQEQSEAMTAASEKVRAMDGCEGMIVLPESDTDAGIVVTLWKDQASYDSYEKVRSEMLAAVERDVRAASSATVSQPQIHEVAYWK